jgi:hypothetical protein
MRAPTSHFVIASTYGFTAILWLLVGREHSPSALLTYVPVAGFAVGAVLEMIQLTRRYGALVLTREQLLCVHRLVDREVDNMLYAGTPEAVEFAVLLRSRVRDALDDRTPGQVTADGGEYLDTVRLSRATPVIPAVKCETAEA